MIALGEMGIANTTSTVCLVACLCSLSVAQCVGRGTRLDDDGLVHKRAVLEAAIARHADVRELLDVLACFGGFEVAAMVGAVFEAAQRRMTIPVDGFIATAAMLVAAHVASDVPRFCVFGYVPDEHGHRALLELLDAWPLLSLSLRPGESSSAVLAYPVVVPAVAFLREMMTLTSTDASGCASP